MDEFTTVLFALLPVLSIVVLGFLVRRVNWLTAEADSSMLRVLVNLLVPCFFLDSLLGNAALERAENVFYPPLVGFLTVTFGAVIAFLFAKLAGLKDLRSRRTFGFATGIYNYGYVPLPLAALLFDRETTGVLVVHNMGVELALWTVGLMMIAGVPLRQSWRKALNPPLVTIVVALTINGLGWTGLVPEFVKTAYHLLGQCAIPMGLVLIGATVADFLPEFRPGSSARLMSVSCLIRLGMLPVLFLLLARFGPFSDELKRVIILQAAMPAAVFPIVMAKHYGGDTGIALRVVLATSAVSLLTIPLWIHWGLAFVGL